MTIEAILACDDKGGISRNGQLPWPKNEADLAYFRSVTLHNTVVMGRKTWDSVSLRPLPLRKNIVISSNTNIAPESDAVYPDINKAIQDLYKDKIFIIGGAMLFESCLDKIDYIYLTHIFGNYECDTYISLDNINKLFICDKIIKLNKSTTVKCYRKN